MPDLFSAAGLLDEPPYAAITQGAALLRGYALRFVTDIRASLELITAQAPFRHMTTPWGAVLSVAMTNCGEAGWLTDRSGYRYDRVDPESASSPVHQQQARPTIPRRVRVPIQPKIQPLRYDATPLLGQCPNNSNALPAAETG